MSTIFDLWLDGIKESLKVFFAPLKEYAAVLSNVWVSLFVIGVVFVLMLSICIARYGKYFQKQICQPRTLTLSSLLIAANIALGYLTLWLSSYLRIGFGFVTQPIVAVLFGPLLCLMTGIAQDVLSYLLNPVGGYIPAYSLCVGISGMIYGLMLYRKPVKLWRVAVAKILVIVFANILLNSIALAPTVGTGFVGILPARIIKNLLLFPIETVVSYLILKVLSQSKQIQIFGE